MSAPRLVTASMQNPGEYEEISTLKSALWLFALLRD